MSLPPTLEATMPTVADRPEAPTAIRTDLGAIYAQFARALSRGRDPAHFRLRRAGRIDPGARFEVARSGSRDSDPSDGATAAAFVALGFSARNQHGFPVSQRRRGACRAQSCFQGQAVADRDSTSQY